MLGLYSIMLLGFVFKDLENFKVNVQERSEELAQAKITYLCSEGEYLGKWVEEDLLENKVKLLK